MSCRLKPTSLPSSFSLIESITQSSVKIFVKPTLSFIGYAKLMVRIHNNYFQVKLLEENSGFNICTNKDIYCRELDKIYKKTKKQHTCPQLNSAKSLHYY